MGDLDEYTMKKTTLDCCETFRTNPDGYVTTIVTARLGGIVL